jgi:hypothetical protein
LNFETNAIKFQLKKIATTYKSIIVEKGGQQGTLVVWLLLLSINLLARSGVYFDRGYRSDIH